MMLKGAIFSFMIAASGVGQVHAASYVDASENAVAASIFGDPSGVLTLPVTAANQAELHRQVDVQDVPTVDLESVLESGRVSAGPVIASPRTNQMPEPQTWMLMMFGLAVVGRAMRQRAPSFC